jgi:uncharacterized membrane protein YjjP (DUF1212 family)
MKLGTVSITVGSLAIILFLIVLIYSSATGLFNVADILLGGAIALLLPGFVFIGLGIWRINHIKGKKPLTE